MGLFNLFKPAKTVLVIDAVSLNESLGMKGNVPPRSQLQTLRRLTRFSEREKIEVIAVLSGTPLNKAPGGKKFESVTVLYSKSADDHAKFLARTVAGKGSGAVLVSGNASVEKLVGSSIRKLRISTFRKAFDVGGDGGDGDSGGDRSDNPRSRSGNRPPRRRQKQSGGNSNNNSKGKDNSNEPKKERPPKEMSEADAINELIDLVD